MCRAHTLSLSFLFSLCVTLTGWRRRSLSLFCAYSRLLSRTLAFSPSVFSSLLLGIAMMMRGQKKALTCLCVSVTWLLHVWLCHCDVTHSCITRLICVHRRSHYFREVMQDSKEAFLFIRDMISSRVARLICVWHDPFVLIGGFTTDSSDEPLERSLSVHIWHGFFTCYHSFVYDSTLIGGVTTESSDDGLKGSLSVRTWHGSLMFDMTVSCVNRLWWEELLLKAVMKGSKEAFLFVRDMLPWCVTWLFRVWLYSDRRSYYSRQWWKARRKPFCVSKCLPKKKILKNSLNIRTGTRTHTHTHMWRCWIAVDRRTPF